MVSNPRNRNDVSGKKHFRISELLNIRNISRSNIHYILTWIIYYAWVIVFTTWWTASPGTDEVFGTGIRVVLHSINLISSAFFVLILKKEHFVKASRTGTVLLLITSVCFLTISNPYYQIVTIIAFGISLGIVNAGILIPFVFVLNNTEKFYAVVLSNVIISILVMLQETGTINITNAMIPSLLILLTGLAPILKFRISSLRVCEPSEEQKIPKAKKILYISVFINCLYAILCKGVGKMFVSLADENCVYNLSVVFYLGALLGCAIYAVIYAFFSRSNIITWNVTFGTFVIGMLVYIAASQNSEAYVLFTVLIGIGSTMGMINMYYILGVIGKKYYSLRYVRCSVLFIGCVGGITGVLLGKWAASYPESIALSIAALSAIVIVILLMMSPMLSRTYFREEWSEDSEKPEIDNDNSYVFKKYGLSRRETELCRLLLDGMTLRQASAAMGISYSTANTYQTALYRKLGINSKTELMLVFKEYVFK